ncbi:MAG: hypothetical protein AB7S38_16420 [Vulcanimicrobiota bacterium]
MGAAQLAGTVFAQIAFERWNRPEFITGYILLSMAVVSLLLVKQGLDRLHALRQGGCLEELWTTGIRASQLVDEVALKPLRSLPKALPVLLLLWPLSHGQAALSPALMVLLCTAIAAAAAAPAFFFAGAGRPAAYLPGLGLMVVGFWLSPLGLPPMTFLMLAGLLHWRYAAARVLETEPERRARGTWLDGRFDNLVISREMGRTRAYHFLPYCVPVLLLGYQPGSGTAILAAVYLVCISSLRTSAALAGEREKRSLDLLVGTGMTHLEFYRGWVALAEVPGLVAAGLAGLMLLTSDFDAYTPLAWAALGLAPRLGAELGLWASARASDRVRSGLRLLTGWVAFFGTAATLWGGLAITTYQWWGGGRRWEDFFLIYAPLASLVVTACAAGLWLRTVMLKQLADTWTGVQPNTQTSRWVGYVEQAAASFWKPGFLFWVPAAAACTPTLANVIDHFDDETCYILVLLVGFVGLASALPWLLFWRPVNRAWTALGPGSVAGRLIYHVVLAVCCGLVSAGSLDLLMQVAGQPAGEALVPGLTCAPLVGLVAASRVER